MPVVRSIAVLVASLAVVPCHGVVHGLSAAATVPTPVIVAFGDSLTAGPGLPRNQTYPALLQRKMVENGYKYRVVNAGKSGDTSTRALRRLDKVLVPETRILILALGINDGLRGIPVETVETNLTKMVERARTRKVEVLLCEMETPPVRGFSYTTEFHNAYTRIATRFRLPLVPFFLYGVIGKPELNLTDGIHPNAAGHALIAEAIWTHLEPRLVR